MINLLTELELSYSCGDLGTLFPTKEALLPETCRSMLALRRNRRVSTPCYWMKFSEGSCIPS